VSWLEALHRELGRAGIRGVTRRRIELELSDHLASDPESEARLGSPGELADQFAAGLRWPRTRRAVGVSFFALALAAVGLVATSRAYVAAGGWPSVHGAEAVLVSIAGVAIFGSSQLALVAGVLGVMRAFNTGRAHVATSELALVQRRLNVALVAAGITAAGILVHAVVLWNLMPWWWDAVSLVSALLPLAALAVAASTVASAGAVTPAGGPPAAGLFADAPHWLAPYAGGLLRRSWIFAGIVGGGVTVLMLALGAHAEGSITEGAVRAAFEGMFFFGCFVLLGRRLGLRA
jgi:hypothetical protein